MLVYLLTEFETKELIESLIRPLMCSSFTMMSNIPSFTVSCLWCHHTKESVLVYTVSDWKAFIVQQLNLTTPKNAASVAVRHCSRNRDNAALTINNSLSKTTIILLCQCILQFQTRLEEIDRLITVSGLLLEVTFILSSDLAGSSFPWGRGIARASI